MLVYGQKGPATDVMLHYVTWRNHVCVVEKDQKLVLSFALKKCEGDVVFGLEWWLDILIIY